MKVWVKVVDPAEEDNLVLYSGFVEATTCEEALGLCLRQIPGSEHVTVFKRLWRQSYIKRNGGYYENLYSMEEPNSWFTWYAYLHSQEPLG